MFNEEVWFHAVSWILETSKLRGCVGYFYATQGEELEAEAGAEGEAEGGAEGGAEAGAEGEAEGEAEGHLTTHFMTPHSCMEVARKCAKKSELKTIPLETIDFAAACRECLRFQIFNWRGCSLWRSTMISGLSWVASSLSGAWPAKELESWKARLGSFGQSLVQDGPGYIAARDVCGTFLQRPTGMLLREWRIRTRIGLIGEDDPHAMAKLTTKTKLLSLEKNICGRFLLNSRPEERRKRKS